MRRFASLCDAKNQDAIHIRFFRGALLSLAAFAIVGCVQTKKHDQELLAEITWSDVPRELDMATIPVYRVAPSDIHSPARSRQ
jgi:hypothetical protein